MSGIGRCFIRLKLNMVSRDSLKKQIKTLRFPVSYTQNISLFRLQFALGETELQTLLPSHEPYLQRSALFNAYLLLPLAFV